MPKHIKKIMIRRDTLSYYKNIKHLFESTNIASQQAEKNVTPFHHNYFLDLPPIYTHDFFSTSLKNSSPKIKSPIWNSFEHKNNNYINFLEIIKNLAR